MDMKTMMKKIIATSLLIFTAAGVQAKSTDQIGFMSDYLFRGITQTDHGFAAYAQTKKTTGNGYGKISFINIDAPDNAEGIPVQMDVSFGYNSKFDGFNIDLEVITYNYLIDSRSDETEFKIGTSLTHSLDIALYRGIKNKTLYAEIVYEKFLTNRLYLDAHVGYATQDDSDDSALDARVELGRDFPEFYGIDIYVAADFITDTTPYGNNSDQDDSEVSYVFGVRKNF
ncbi:hypothetical protein GCM10008107_04050 [Psychrosphaera saromensis]|nr:hypothetical protein GCM10008107_04050 [Psychrosphaera saromensis]GLQ14126.1 hypothetical protein GCM10007917_15810 [Psychrosphaera saromensis]